MADFEYFLYTMQGNGRLNGTVDGDTGTAGFQSSTVSDVDGSVTNGDTIVVNGVTYTISGVVTSGVNTGDFTATDGAGQFYFSSNSALNTSGGNTGFDADAPANGYSATGTISLTCFLPGTLIATERGEVAIEDLVIGDKLPTVDGTVATVRWVAKQSVATLFAPRETSLPICITAGALGGGLPRRDLYVSPGHAMLVDGRLVSASALVNGATIYQVESMPAKFQYLHIETEGHHAIFAEGAAAETFVDNTPRAVFDNWDDYQATYPDWQPIAEMGLPRVSARRLLPAETKARLAMVAAELMGKSEKAA